jgi:DNA-directed RNA polymerase subunit RPC12/RpoP
VSAQFGHVDNKFQLPNSRGEHIPSNLTTKEFIDLCRDVVDRREMSWLQVAGYGLDAIDFGGNGLFPTVVLVDSVAIDLSLFWNLRMASISALPAIVVPVPAADAVRPEVLDSLAGWVTSINRFARDTNQLFVISGSAGVDLQSSVARQLQDRLRGEPERTVQVRNMDNVPVVLAFESEKTLDVDITNNEFSWQPPRPAVADHLNRSETWVVDLVKDLQTNRMPQDLSLPPRASATDVLNAPFPPWISFSHIPKLGFGLDSINVLCSTRDEFNRQYLPTPTELLEAIVREHGIELRHDEKRTCYLPAFELLGKPKDVARTFTGQRWLVLKELLKGPARTDEIQGRAKLGSGKISDAARPQLHDEIFRLLSPVVRPVVEQRFNHWWDDDLPGDTKLQSLLEHWSDKSIVRRKWRLGPCKGCGNSYWEDHIDITQPVLCPGCGGRLILKSSVPLGYEMNPMLKHAIEEGIVPVALVGRFLENLTRFGFQWIPGVKCRFEKVDHDIDIIACCDGRIVIVECKNLEGVTVDVENWGKKFARFEKLMELAAILKADLLILAALVDSFPEQPVEEAKKAAGNRFGIQFLNRDDLTKGYRGEEPQGLRGQMMITDFCPR